MDDWQVGKAKGILKNFLIEPFVPHKQVNLIPKIRNVPVYLKIITFFFGYCQEEEFYVCIYAAREGDYILFHHEGGVDVGDVDAKAQKLLIKVDEKIDEDQVKKALLTKAPNDKRA